MEFFQVKEGSGAQARHKSAVPGGITWQRAKTDEMRSKSTVCQTHLLHSQGA